MKSRLTNVNWLSVAGRGLDCPFKPELLGRPVLHDVTGDRILDSFVHLDCWTGDSRYPTTVLVHDGASDPTAPRQLGTLLTFGDDT